MHTHFSAIHGLGMLASVVATVGVINLLVRQHPDHPAAQGWMLVASPGN